MSYKSYMQESCKVQNVRTFSLRQHSDHDLVITPVLTHIKLSIQNEEKGKYRQQIALRPTKVTHSQKSRRQPEQLLMGRASQGPREVGQEWTRSTTWEEI